MLTGCEQDLAINLPGCFRLLFLLSFIRKTEIARLKNPTDLLHKNLMKPLGRTREEFLNHEPQALTSQVVYHPITHGNLRSVAFI